MKEVHKHHQLKTIGTNVMYKEKGVILHLILGFPKVVIT